MASGNVEFLPSAFKILHCAFVFLRGFARRKRTQVFAFSCPGVLLAGIETVLT
jgi:hypothetical protein